MRGNETKPNSTGIFYTIDKLNKTAKPIELEFPTTTTQTIGSNSGMKKGDCKAKEQNEELKCTTTELGWTI